MDYQKKLVVGNLYLTDSMVGVARKQHAFVDTEGNRYIAIGTDKFLLIFLKVNYLTLHHYKQILHQLHLHLMAQLQQQLQHLLHTI